MVTAVEAPVRSTVAPDPPGNPTLPEIVRTFAEVKLTPVTLAPFTVADRLVGVTT